MPVTRTALTNIVPTSVNTTGGTTTINATTGMVTCTSATGISLNNVFSATYDNYLINVNGTNSGSTYDFKLRTGGGSPVDISSDYWFFTEYFYSGTYTTQQNGTAASTGGGRAGIGAGYHSILQITLTAPFLAQRTVGYIDGSGGYSGPSIHHGVFLHNIATSYPSFTLITGSAFTGYITVYGYTK